jgi:hypothetical protein
MLRQYSVPTRRIVPLADFLPTWEVLKGREEEGRESALRVSVVIAFEDPRAEAGHLQTWTVAQTLPADEFEIVVVTDGAHPGVERAVAALLRPQDVLVRAEGADRFVLCNIGAEVALAETLLFTEDHCLAEPGCLELAARTLIEQKVECSTLNWGNINENYVGAFEEQVTRENMEIWQQPDHWNMLRARGFVITRRAYEKAGCFPSGYGLFAEAVFAARLHEAGIKVGYTSEVGVRHINSGSLRDLAGNARGYSYHECLGAVALEATFFDRYFNLGEVLFTHRIPPREAKAAVQLVWREVMRELRAQRSRFKPWRLLAWGRLLLETWGQSLSAVILRWRARLATWNAWVGCQLWRRDPGRRYAAFSSFWRCVVHGTRTDFFSRRHSPVREAPGAGNYEGARLAKLPGWGIYPTERVEGRQIRWTGGLAIIPFELPAGEFEFVLDSAGLRAGDCRFPFVIYWGRRRVARRELQFDGPHVTFKVAATGRGRQWLRILVPVLLKSAEDGRRLGFPLAGIQLQAVKTEAMRAVASVSLKI